MEDLPVLKQLLLKAYVVSQAAPITGFALGFCLLCWWNWFRKAKEDKGSINLWTAPVVLFAAVSWVSVIVFRELSVYPPEQVYRFSLPFLGACTALGFVWALFFFRYITPKINEKFYRSKKTSGVARNAKTDVRDIAKQFPQGADYDPERYFDESRVFIGLGADKKPQYIPLDQWQTSHAQIIGTTGAGKGVAASMLLAQSIKVGEAVFVLDPKNDEWAPHVMRHACEKAGKPFHLINLSEPAFQLDFLGDINADQLEELFIAGFGLAEKGDAADFYRIEDRRTARIAATLAGECRTFRDIFKHDIVEERAGKAPNFYGKLEEIALLNSVNASNGLNLADIEAKGGCVYVIGSMRNSRIISAQRMLLVRLIQLAETRDRINQTPRPMAIFLDELKYHISRPALEGLGAARDKGVHIIMAHQSLADLRDCPADLDPDAVTGSVVENASFKLVYRVKDPNTAEWLAEMSGKILVDDEVRKTNTNAAFSETVEQGRTIRQSESYLVDTNMLLNLPKKVGYIFSNELPRATIVSHIQAGKQPLEVSAVEPENEPDFPVNQAAAAIDIASDEIPKENPREKQLDAAAAIDI